MNSVAKIQFDPVTLREVEALLGNLAGRNGFSAFAVAQQAAVSRTVTTGVARVARLIGDAVNLPIGQIKALISAKRGSYEKPEGTITITRKTVWLSQFLTAGQRKSFREGRRARSVLAVRVRKRGSGKYPGGAQTIQRGFVAMGAKSNYVGVFQREGKARLPIHRLKGPTALGILAHAKGTTSATILEDALADLNEVLDKNLRQQIGRFIK